MSLIDKMPDFYDNELTRPIQDSLNEEIILLNNAIADTKAQFFIDTATWGLDYWERMFNIPKNNLDVETRRENLKAKRRTAGVSNEALIKSICEAYSNGEVELENDKTKMNLKIKFVGTVGVPKRIDQISKMLEQILPCHYSHEFIYRYNTHNDLSKYTHDELKAYTHDELRNSPDIRRD